ncbi:hypothetical protein Peur_044388 [Populus x canadensis]
MSHKGNSMWEVYTCQKLKGRWMTVRYNRPINPRDGMQQIYGYSHCWRVSSPDVNCKPRLSSNKEKIYVVLASTLIEYKGSRIAKVYYQIALQRLTAKEKGETSTRFTEKSLPKKIFVSCHGRRQAEEVMDNYPIIVNELFVLEETTTGVRTTIEDKVGCNHINSSNKRSSRLESL